MAWWSAESGACFVLGGAVAVAVSRCCGSPAAAPAGPHPRSAASDPQRQSAEPPDQGPGPAPSVRSTLVEPPDQGPGPGPSVRSTLVGCVTLHAVIDENFTVTGFEPAVTQRASHYEACYVGKGISCANAVADLGNAAAAAVLVLCGAADCDTYESALQQHGFGAVHVIGGPAATRRHATIINPASDAPVTHVQVPGIPHPAELFAPTHQLTTTVAAMGAEGGLVALSGSLPKGAPLGFYGDLVRAIADAGGRALVDTSGAALVEALKASPFAVKPNRAEAEALLGRKLGDAPHEHAAAAAEIRTTYAVEWVILSDSAAGLVAVCGAGSWHGRLRLEEAERSGVVNDQGCGDSLVAGFLSAFAEAATQASALSDMPGTPPWAQRQPQPEEVVRQMLLSATANLFTSQPGELSAPHLQSFRDQGAIELTPLS